MSGSIESERWKYRCEQTHSRFMFPPEWVLGDGVRSVSVSAQEGIVALGKAHTRSGPSVSSLPKVALETVPIFAWLNTDRSRPWRMECFPLPFSTPLPLQAINPVMLWPVHAQKVPQASGHLCHAKLQTRCDICCACQCICSVIPTDSSVPRTADPQRSL